MFPGEEGLERGRDEGRHEIARKLKARGHPLEEIAEDPGMDLESIRNL